MPWKLRKRCRTGAVPPPPNVPVTECIRDIPVGPVNPDVEPTAPETTLSPGSVSGAVSIDLAAGTRSTSPCETCGACCAMWTVAFPNSDVADINMNAVLLEMSSPKNHSTRFMKGTDGRYPRCIALEGTVGHRVRCMIYENRPSTCRDFSRSWADNTGNGLCDKARSVFGLLPFSQY